MLSRKCPSDNVKVSCKYCIRVVLRENFDGIFCNMFFFTPFIDLTCLSEGVKSAHASLCTSNGGFLFIYF